MSYSPLNPIGSYNPSITVPDNVISSSPLLYDASKRVGIQLVGDNALNYGTAIAQNFIQLTSNFAGPLSSRPIDSIALQGQLWFNATTSTTGDLFVRKTTNGVTSASSWEKILTVDPVSGVLSVGNGGTGFTSYTTGDMLVGNSSGGLNKLTIGTNGYVLTVVSGNPTWAPASGGGGGVSSVSASSPLSSTGGTTPNISLSGIVGVANGGTGQSSFSAGYIKSNGTALSSSSTIPSTDITGTVSIANGGTGQTNAEAAINALLPVQSPSTNGTFLTSNGTNAIWSQTIPFPTYFESDELTVPAIAGSVSASHGLGTVPFSFSAVLRCKIADAGYSPGDEAIIPTDIADSNTAWANSSVVGFSKDGAALFVTEKSGGNSNAITAANWRIVLRAFAVSSVVPTPSGAPQSLSFITSWAGSGTPTSSLTLTGSATGDAPLQYDWSIDGGATFPITNTNPATFTGIDNSLAGQYTVNVVMKVKNAIVPSGVTYARTLINPNYPYIPPGGEGGGGSGGGLGGEDGGGGGGGTIEP